MQMLFRVSSVSHSLGTECFLWAKAGAVGVPHAGIQGLWILTKAGLWLLLFSLDASFEPYLLMLRVLGQQESDTNGVRLWKWSFYGYVPLHRPSGSSTTSLGPHKSLHSGAQMNSDVLDSGHTGDRVMGWREETSSVGFCSICHDKD